jgi:hypothetical protein
MEKTVQKSNSNPRFFIGTEVEGRNRGIKVLFISDDLDISELFDLIIKYGDQVDIIYFGAGDYRKVPRKLPMDCYLIVVEHYKKFLVFEIDDLDEISYIPTLPNVEVVFVRDHSKASDLKRITAFKLVDKDKVVMVYPQDGSFDNDLKDPLYRQDKEVTI